MQLQAIKENPLLMSEWERFMIALDQFILEAEKIHGKNMIIHLLNT